MYLPILLVKVSWYLLSEKYAFCVTLRHLGSMRQGKADLSTLHNIRRGKAELRILELTSLFHHLPSVSPKQLCALAHLRCTYGAVTS